MYKIKLFSFSIRKFLFVSFSIIGTLVNGQELIQDRDFQQGFYVINQFTFAYEGPILCSNTLPTPVWNVAEWNSQSSVLGLTHVTLGNGMCQWADQYKDFRFGGPIGADEYQLYFAVNSNNEYNSIYNQQGDPWVHLLVEQRLSPPFDFPGQGPGCPPLSDIDSLVFQINAKLFYNQTIMNTGYDSNIHAAQFPVYFTVQNLNTASAGYGKYVWLGLLLYDDRTPVPTGGISYDIGTQTLINQIPYTDFASVTIHNGTWVHAQVDLLPYALNALNTAWSQGFLNESTNLADYKIGGMNMGWEVPGLNICTVGINGISLFAYLPTTTIKNNTELSFSVFPNPTTDKVTINYTETKNARLQIYDILGKCVLTRDLRNGQNDIDVSKLSKGGYMIKVKTNDGIIVKKLIKQ